MDETVSSQEGAGDLGRKGFQTGSLAACGRRRGQGRALSAEGVQRLGKVMWVASLRPCRAYGPDYAGCFPTRIHSHHSTPHLRILCYAWARASAFSLSCGALFRRTGDAADRMRRERPEGSWVSLTHPGLSSTTGHCRYPVIFRNARDCRVDETLLGERAHDS